MENKLDIIDIFELVEKHFKGIVDKANKPYVGHVYRVYENVLKSGGDFEQQVIALLHDSVEDLPHIFTIEMLNNYFSKRIIDGILAMTKIKGESYCDYINRLISNKDAIKVKIADLKDNMDITRFTEVELLEKDLNKLKKYHNTYLKLIKL